MGMLHEIIRTKMSHETNTSVALGMVSGMTANVITASIGTSLAIAFLTGAAGYIGQQVAKNIQIKFKKYRDEKCNKQ
jgi:uncharacterized protein YejL (UPF0352 family)